MMNWVQSVNSTLHGNVKNDVKLLILNHIITPPRSREAKKKKRNKTKIESEQG